MEIGNMMMAIDREFDDDDDDDDGGEQYELGWR